MFYNEFKTEQIENPDLRYGYLVDDELIIEHKEIKEQPAEGHYEVIAEYPNGGKDVEFIIDKPAVEPKEAYTEHIPIQVYIPYTEEEIKKKEAEDELAELKQILAGSDYKAIKYAEGWYTEDEYAETKVQREQLRIRIRELLDIVQK